METIEKLNFYDVLLPLALGGFIIVLGVVFLNMNFQKNLHRQKRRQEELNHQHEVELLETSAQVQEEERKRIATDLHDRLGSMLATVKLLYSSVDEAIDKAQPGVYSNFNKANALLNEAVLEVRKIAQDLNTGVLIEMGLRAALQDLCSSIHRSKKVECRLLSYGEEKRPDQKTEIGVYRMLQEILNNALKHAEARRLTLQLNYTPNVLTITVEDDGLGFNVVAAETASGLGLKNLRARAEKLNVTYSLDSQPGRGTLSIIEIPLNRS